MHDANIEYSRFSKESLEEILFHTLSRVSFLYMRKRKHEDRGQFPIHKKRKLSIAISTRIGNWLIV